MSEEKGANAVPIEFSNLGSNAGHNQRRNSILLNTDNLTEMNTERRSSIDAIISSIAHQTARRSSVTMLGQDANRDRQHEHQEKVDHANNEQKRIDIEDHPHDDNRFEESIKENKLPSEEAGSSNSELGAASPGISPLASHVNLSSNSKHLEPSQIREISIQDKHRENPSEREQDIANTHSFDERMQRPEEEYSENKFEREDSSTTGNELDPITLISDKHQSELSQYIPEFHEQSINNNGVSDFNPTSEQLKPEPISTLQNPDKSDTIDSKESTSQFLLDVSHEEQIMDHEGLPGKDEHCIRNEAIEPLPWEKDELSTKNLHDSLPWEPQNEEQPAQEQIHREKSIHECERKSDVGEENYTQLSWEKLTDKHEGKPGETEESNVQFPWEKSTDEGKSATAKQDHIKSSWESQPINEDTVTECQDGKKQEKMPWEIEVVSEELKQALPWEEHNQFYESVPQKGNVDFNSPKDQCVNETAVDADDSLSSESVLELPHSIGSNFSAPKKGDANSANEIDPLLFDNQSIGNRKGQSVSSLSNTDNQKTTSVIEKLLMEDNDFIVSDTKSNQDASCLEYKSEILSPLDDLDLDDDLLLDDEFLEDEQVMKTYDTHKSQSSAQSGDKYTFPTKNLNQNFSNNLELAKKKNDAFDFPDNLITQKIKPAQRATNKYSNGRINDNQFHVSQNSPSKLNLKPTKSESASKSFFEELPVALPKSTKPARAAAQVATPNLKKNVPAFVPATNIPFQPAPPNPYAKLGSQGPATSNNNHPSNGSMPPKLNTNKTYMNHAPSQIPNNQYSNVASISSNASSTSNAPAPAQNNLKSPLNQANTSVRNTSSSSPNMINTTTAKVHSSNSTTSPYVPNAGPYAPNNNRRTHVRASSIVGAKGKEINPYAPIPTTNIVTSSVNQSGVVPPVNNLTHGILSNQPNSGSIQTLNRSRKASNARPSIYNKSQAITKALDPNASFTRQFPIFNWNNSHNVVSVIPNFETKAINSDNKVIKIRNVSEVLKHEHLDSFPGPLNKIKSKKRDIEKWLEVNIERLNMLDNWDNTELILNHVLLNLLRFDGDFKSLGFSKVICSILNPTVDYYTEFQVETASALMVSNSCKLDPSGINTVFHLIQTGNVERALEYSISRGDWAFSLILANFSGDEKFSKLVSDYARSIFPFQKSNNKVHHLMPILLKLFSGNTKNVIDDFKNVASEREWAISHWREIVSLSLINASPVVFEFIQEFGTLLIQNGKLDVGEICYILSGRHLSPVITPECGQFTVISKSFIYTEIYEYILSLMPNSIISPLGLPHLVHLKLKHALILADYGLFGKSQKYVDTINSMLKSLSKSPYINSNMLSEFQNLIIRISGSESVESGWFSGKISKVNLDRVWGQIDKFIGGDEALSKSNEAGVFSKFSPSVSRTASTLDLTVAPQTIQGRPDLRDSGTINLIPSGFSDPYSGNTTSQGKVVHDIRPSFVPSNSTASVAKYTQPSNAAPLTSYDMSSSNPSHANASPYMLTNGKYAPSNISSQSLSIKEHSKSVENFLQPSKKPPSKYSPSIARDVSLTTNQTQPFSSIPGNAVVSQSNHIKNSNFNANHSSLGFTTKRPSIDSVLPNDNFVNLDTIRGHNHSPSIQSDISLDYPQEFKSTPKRANNFPDLQISPIGLIKEKRKEIIDPIPQTITESPELVGTRILDIPKSPNDDSLSEKANDFNTVQHEEIDADTESTDNQLIYQNFKPTEGNINVSKKTAPKINPYAPGSSTSKQGTRRSKYGPPPGNSNKYSVPTNISETLVKASYADFFGPQNERNRESASKIPAALEIKDNQHEDNNAQSLAPSKNFYSSASESVNDKKNDANSPNFTPLQEIPMTTAEVGFEQDHTASGNTQIQTSKPKKSLFLKSDSSLLDADKPSMFNSYPTETSRRPSNIGIDNSFGEFSIPGSPDYTTRENSVIGGPSGLFTSRLSESQQSALYQQYEVRDDTVKDYIPPIEEDEEDEDEDLHHKSKDSKDRKEEQENSAEKNSQTSDNGNAKKNAGSGKSWWWLGKNDGKPSPIRAKLGEENMFYWSEEHKRYINKNIPIEDQIKDSKPPPPPMAKKPEGLSKGSIKQPSQLHVSSTNMSHGGNPDRLVDSINATRGSTGKMPPKLNAEALASVPKPPPGPSLATAGLDDLLSLGGGSSYGSTRKAKRGARRGYVNVMDQK